MEIRKNTVKVEYLAMLQSSSDTNTATGGYFYNLFA